MTKQPTDIQIDFADIYPSTQQQKKLKKGSKQKVSTPENIDIGEIYDTQQQKQQKEQKEQKKTQKKNKQNKQKKQKQSPEFELSQVYDNTNIVPISSSSPSSTWVMPSSILLAVVMLVSTLAISTRRKGN